MSHFANWASDMAAGRLASICSEGKHCLHRAHALDAVTEMRYRGGKVMRCCLCGSFRMTVGSEEQWHGPHWTWSREV